MFHSRKVNNKINILRKRCLRIVYSDNTSVHNRTIQVLEIELYKIVNGLPPEIMKEVFPFNETYNTRNKNKVSFEGYKIVYGSETLSHLALEIWEFVPVEIKIGESVSCLRELLKNGKQ